METAHEYMVTSRRQLIQIIARTLCGGGLGVIGVMLLVLAAFPGDLKPGIYLAMLGLVVGGSALTLWLLDRQPLSYAMLPLVVALIGGVTFSAIIFRETTLAALPFLAIVVLLISLSQRRSTMVMVGVICVVFGVGLALTAPHPVLEAGAVSLGPALPLVFMASAGVSITTIWLIAMRLVTISDQALGLADQRAFEAEQARGVAESRSAELAEQYEAQQRLLALVATLETPAVALAEDVVLLPLIGHIDTRRAADLTEHLLNTVYQRKIHFVIMDVTGIAVLDSGVVQNLLRAVQSVRLLGAQVILCGIQAPMASALVQLGADFAGQQVVRTPQEALELIVSLQSTRQSRAA